MFVVSFRSFAENLHHPCVLILAIPENGDPSYNMNEHSQGFKDGEELARSLGGTFMRMTSSFHLKSKKILSNFVFGFNMAFSKLSVIL